MPDFGLTVKCLKKWIERFPDDARVYYQRIEDVYFEKYGWGATTIQNKVGDRSFYGDYVWLLGMFFDKKKNILYLSAHY